MILSNLQYETSEHDGKPVECYRFSYNGLNYNYTSSDHDVTLVVGGEQEVFSAQYIKRTNLKPTSLSTVTVSVELNNPIAVLYKGPPPEQGKVRLRIFRLHGTNTTDFDTMLWGTISQCSFKEAQAELTVTVEGFLQKEIPRGKLQYWCNNIVYDHICTLKEEEFQTTCKVTQISGMSLFAEELKQFNDGYFVGGILRIDDNIRSIVDSSSDGYVTIKYPFATQARTGEFTVAPGCNGLFLTCASKFKNTDNFMGVPYTPPTDPEKNPTGGGTYWIDDLIVKRDSDGFIGNITL